MTRELDWQVSGLIQSEYPAVKFQCPTCGESMLFNTANYTGNLVAMLADLEMYVHPAGCKRRKR